MFIRTAYLSTRSVTTRLADKRLRLRVAQEVLQKCYMSRCVLLKPLPCVASRVCQAHPASGPHRSVCPLKYRYFQWISSLCSTHVAPYFA